MVGSKWAMCLKTGAREEVDKCNDFLKLMQLEWSLKVSKIALVTLQTRRFNAVRLLPVPDDLVKLQDHVKSELTGQRLEAETVHLEIYRRVVELCQTRLLLYNKRRSGEIEAITVKQYTKRQSGVSDIDRSMRAHLSKLEEHLLVSQELIETRGKGGRGVPVTVPLDTKRALQFISNICIRHEAGILPDNVYLFPNTSDGTAPLNGVSDDEMQPDIQTVDTYDEYVFQDEDSPKEETKRKSKSQNTRVAWTPTEINEIQEYFETNINSGVTPGRKECLKAIEQSRKKKGSIHRRQWETIKKKVWNLIQKNKL